MKHIILVLALIPFFAHSQIKKSHSMLVDSGTLYKVLNANPIDKFDLYKSTELKDTTIDGEEFGVLMVNPSLDIVAYNHHGYTDIPLKKQRDFLMFNKQKILVDSVLSDGNLSPNYMYMTYFYASYTFHFKDRKYCALFSDNSYVNTSLPNAILLLFDITEPNFKIILSDYQACGDLSCFGKSMRDGNLEYISWSQGIEFSNKIYFYTLDPYKNKFVKDHYIRIHEAHDWGKFVLSTH